MDTSQNKDQSNGENNDKPNEQKVTFSLNLKPTKQTAFVRKPLNEDDEKPERDYITGMSGNKLVSAKPKEKKGPLVIPLSHGWRALPGDQNDLIKAQQKSDEKAVSEVLIKEEGASQATETFGDGSVATGTKVEGYGLQDEDDDEVVKRQAKQRLQAQKEAVKTSAGRDVSSIPPILRNLPAGIHDLNDETAKFKFDLERRPESATNQEYEAVPVDQFGEALLRGMGWAPGAAIGGKITKVWEPEKRHHRLGLGAAPAPMIDPKKKGRMNITAMIGQPSAAAQQKGFKNGALVGIVSGPYDGLYAKITQLGGEKSLIKIVGQTDEMIVSHEDLTVVDPRKLGKDHPALQKDDDTHSDRHRDKHSSSSHKHRDDDTKHKDKKRRTDDYEYDRDKSSSKRDSDRHDSKHSDKNGSDSKHKSSSSSSASAATPAPNWVTTEIRVKINSKSYRDGKYYGMKGRVLDILPGNKCSVVLEEYDRVLDDVDPRHMETVMPATGGVIKVLVGPHKGHTGTLMERDNAKGTVQVQLHDDLSIQVLSMDDVAQFFGHVDV